MTVAIRNVMKPRAHNGDLIAAHDRYATATATTIDDRSMWLRAPDQWAPERAHVRIIIARTVRRRRFVCARFVTLGVRSAAHTHTHEYAADRVCAIRPA